MDPADLNFPRREFSNGGLGIVVTLLVRRQSYFFVCILPIGNPAIVILMYLIQMLWIRTTTAEFFFCGC